MKVAIVGGGAAGTAAAWSARRAGAEVTLFCDRSGSTALYSGAIDHAFSDSRASGVVPAPEVLGFAAALDAWTLGSASVRVATYEGVLRSARGMDGALLDVSSLSGRRIAVADAPIDGFRGAAIAKALGASQWAARTRTRFDAVAVNGILDSNEARAPAFDVARLHDSPERLARLAECLHRADASAEAWLVGPWLGTTVGPADALRKAMGRAIGETTSPPGGAAGARFEASRDVMLSSIGVAMRAERVDAIERREGHWYLTVAQSDSSRGTDAEVNAIVLAIGGVAAGGVTLTVWEGSHGPLTLSLRAPVRLGLAGRMLEASARSGPDWASLGISALERLGILADGVRVAGSEALFAVGDAVADRPRTVLEAVRSGIEAGTLATRHQ